MVFIDHVKEVVDLVEATGDLALYKRVLDIQRQALEVLQENDELKRQITRLQEQLGGRDQLVLGTDGKYYLNGENDSRQGPICPNCFKTRGVVVFLRELTQGGELRRCSACQTNY